MRKLVTPLLLIAVALAWPAPTRSQAGRRSESLAAALDASQGRPVTAWLFLRDKGPDAAIRVERDPLLPTPRALSRRERRGFRPAGALSDAPVFEPYVQEIARHATRVRHGSRWLNAVSVEATPSQIAELEALPFVQRLDLVRRYRRGREPASAAPAAGGASALSSHAAVAAHALSYGTSLNQVAQIGVPAVHDAGLHGEGLLIAVLDGGFNNLAHEALATMQVVAAHDFVNGDDDVGDSGDRGDGSHGTATLSAIGGFKDGQLVGPAFAAGFILAKTEDSESETPIEEDNWAAAAEWAEALGADVISTSLGYLEYDSPFPSYSFADMNGATAVSTLAANYAYAMGVVVVASAGNNGFDATHNTLGAPADGFGTIAAGAVDATGLRAPFSSVGPTVDGRFKPDVAAQGVAVKTASPFSPSAYQLVNGTSFSCPLTAGVAALVLQAHPDYTPEQLGIVLRSTASQVSAPDNQLGWGIVNALAAIQAPAPPRHDAQ